MNECKSGCRFAGVFKYILLLFVIASFMFLSFEAGSYYMQDIMSGASSGVTVYNRCDRAALELDGHEEHKVTIALPAISRNGTGVSARLDVAVIPGSGMVLVNINRVLSREETQQSVRTAALVASDITNLDLGSVDLIYDIYANATVLEGPSAGAALTLATIAAITNRTINNDAMITGTINHDGTIGPAGMVLEKAIAAKNNGATTFFVPVGSATEVNYTESEFCYTWGTYDYCQSEMKSETVNLEDIAGIDIVEAARIEDIMEYFFK